MILLNLLWLECVFVVVHGAAHSKLLYQWKYIDYVWKHSSDRQNAIDSGNYTRDTCIPFDVDQAPDGRIFVTVVRNQGVPATLSTVSRHMGDGGPLLKPYPNWSWNQRKDCSGIKSVFRVAIKCNHLFVLDCGTIGDDHVCPAQLLIFDLRNDKLVKRVIIPDRYARNANGTGLLVTPVVEAIDDECRQLKFNVYMADVEGFGLIVWNGKDFTRLESPYFEADPKADNITVNGTSFQISDGLMGMALARDGHNHHNPILYFRPLASYEMYSTTTKQLLRSIGGDHRAVEYFKGPTKLTSQSAAQAMSKEGILFFSGSREMSILCWNRHKSFTPENKVTILQNNELLQFASGVKIAGKWLYIMTNRFQKVATNTLNITDVNFRIFVGNVKKLVHGTNCEKN